MHTAAREMVYVAEQGLMADGKNTLDPTWQEMLNHATAKVTKKRRWTCKRITQRCYNCLLLIGTVVRFGETFLCIDCIACRWRRGWFGKKPNLLYMAQFIGTCS